MGEKRMIAVLGAGAWGTALAAAMVSAGNGVRLWGRDTAVCREINETRRNSAFLGDAALPGGLDATTSLEAALDGADVVLIVIPAQAISRIAGLLAGATPLGNGVPLVVCAKGIDRESGLLPAQTLEKVLPGRAIAALSGPSFAADIVRGKPTAVTLAASQMDAALQLSEQLSGPNLRVYASDDLTGVELGGALKNVIAVAVGACRGMELGASAEAALITRGFRELMRIATALGARNETLMGLSGLGDLVLTCSSPQSRNFSYGMKLGQGVSTEGLPLAEGAFTADVAARIAKERGIEAPLTTMVAAMVEGRLTAGEAKQALLARPLKSEGE